MKNLILTSNLYMVIDKIIPLLPKNPSETTVAFIPTASGVYKDAPWVEQDRAAFVAAGFKLHEADVSGKTKEELESLLTADIIFAAGGNVFYFLQELQKSGADEIIKHRVENGTLYIGSSAGSVVTCPSIELFRGIDKAEKAPELRGTNGLGLIDVIPLVHFGGEAFKAKYEQAFQTWFGANVKSICIRDDQALIVTDETYRLI